MPSIAVTDLAARLDEHVPPNILDVRTPEEFAAGHVPGAVNIPFSDIARRIADVPGRPDHELVVYCGHGPRAWMAGHVLRRHGFRRVTSLRGHWVAWRRAGLRIET